MDDSQAVSEVAKTQTRKPHGWRARRQDRCPRCEDEAHGDQAEDGQKQETGGADSGTSGSVAGRPCQPAKRGGRQAAGRSQQGRDRESHLRSNRSCEEGKRRGSELYRRSPRRQRRHAMQPNETSSRCQPKQFSVHRGGGRVIEEVKANMFQDIMQSASESESDDDDEEREDEAKNLATRDKQTRSSRNKERRKNRRKFGSKLKDELFTVSTATEVQGQEMMIIKDVNLTVQRDRAVRQGHSDRESTTVVKCETHQRESCSQSRSIQEPMQLSSRGKQMVRPSGGDNYREHRERDSRGRERQLGHGI